MLKLQVDYYKFAIRNLDTEQTLLREMYPSKEDAEEAASEVDFNWEIRRIPHLRQFYTEDGELIQ